MILKSVCQRLVENDITTLELTTTNDHFQCHTGSIYTEKNRIINTTSTCRSEGNDWQPPKQQRNMQLQPQQPIHLRGVLLVDEGSRLSSTQINQLCKALQANRSVQYVCVGPKTVLTFRHLWMILEAIASIPTLTSLHLDLQTWIPEGMLRRILTTCAAQSSIKSLQMTLTRVSSDHMPTTPTSSSKPVADYSSPGSSSLWMTPSPHNWFFCLFSPGGASSGGAGGGLGGLGVSSGGAMGLSGLAGNGIEMGMGGGGRPSGFCQGSSPSSSRMARYEYYFPQEVRMGNVLCAAPNFLQNLNSLKLEYCGIRDEDIIQVCKYLVKNDLVLEELSLIGNRKISTRGIQAMFPSSTTTNHRTTRYSSQCNPLATSHHQQQQQCQYRDTPKILRLDLTDCDLSRDQFRVLVNGLVQQQQQEQQYLEDFCSSTALTSTLTTLQELVVAWNHQLLAYDLENGNDGGDEEVDDDEDEDSKHVAEVHHEVLFQQHPSSSSNDTVLGALVEVFRTRKLLDISCCGIGHAEMNAFFPLLHDDRRDSTADGPFVNAGTRSPLQQQQQRLESLFIRGTYPTPGPALRDLIRNTSTLKHLHLIRTDTAYLTEEEDGILLNIAEALETNYTLESLTLALPLPLEDVADDSGLFGIMHPATWQRHYEMGQTWKTIQMYLALNRAGRRRILAPSPQDGQCAGFGANDWASVLSNVSDELDCVYWLLRNGDPGILLP
jgi:hypothetical protein